MHEYYGHEYHYENIAHAYADDFSHEDADRWDCYNCTPNDELDTPCSKCGGVDSTNGDGTDESGDAGNPDDGTTPIYIADSSTRTLAPASGVKLLRHGRFYTRGESDK